MKTGLTKAASLASVLLCLLCSGHTYACDKKGVGIVRMNSVKPVDDLTVMNAHWYYDWIPTHPNDDAQVPFVPMVNGKRVRIQSDLRFLASSPEAPILLGFNEPDIQDQANMTVEEAISLWPNLQPHAVRMGSPAASMFGLRWLRQFMAQARAKHLKVDFIAVHYYGPPDAPQFLSMIDRVHEEFNLPVWITEFAVRSNLKDKNPRTYTPDEVLNFMHIVLPELERRSYVERFAWWGIGGTPPEAIKSSWFFRNDGSLTEVGRYYASVEANASGALCGTP